jgi:hypothetical protein
VWREGGGAGEIVPLREGDGRRNRVREEVRKQGREMERERDYEGGTAFGGNTLLKWWDFVMSGLEMAVPPVSKFCLTASSSYRGNRTIPYFPLLVKPLFLYAAL